MAGVVVVIGTAFLVGKPWFPDLPTSLGSVFAAACFVAALAAIRLSARLNRSHRIVITPEGVVRIFPEGRNAVSAVAAAAPGRARPANVERIACWPNVVILVYQDGDGRSGSVFLMPRSVSPGAFRPLCVALRWITLQNDPAQGEPR